MAGGARRRGSTWIGRVLTAIELTIAVAALLLIFGLVLLQAGQRYLPIDGWPWTGELARFCLVWLTFVTAGVLVTKDSHISIEMIDMVRGDLLRRVVRVVSCLIVAAHRRRPLPRGRGADQTPGILKSPAHADADVVALCHLDDRLRQRGGPLADRGRQVRRARRPRSRRTRTLEMPTA